jgi:hypothetical protein
MTPIVVLDDTRTFSSSGPAQRLFTVSPPEPGVYVVMMRIYLPIESEEVGVVYEYAAGGTQFKSVPLVHTDQDTDEDDYVRFVWGPMVLPEPWFNGASGEFRGLISWTPSNPSDQINVRCSVVRVA